MDTPEITQAIPVAPEGFVASTDPGAKPKRKYTRRAVVGPALAPPVLMADGKPPDTFAVSAAWQGLFIILILVGKFVGYECDVKSLPPEEADADAAVMLPVILKYPILTAVLSWLGAPVVIVRRVIEHFRPAPKPVAKPKEPLRPVQNAEPIHSA